MTLTKWSLKISLGLSHSALTFQKLDLPYKNLLNLLMMLKYRIKYKKNFEGWKITKVILIISKSVCLKRGFMDIYVDVFPMTSLPQEPFNAEPPRSALISSYITPVHFFYKRNHGPIPLVDDIERFSSSSFFFFFIFSIPIITKYKPFLLHYRYCVSINGLTENPKELFMNDIRWAVWSVVDLKEPTQTLYINFYRASKIT